MSNLDPSDFRNIDAAIFEFDPLRDAERLLSAVFLLEFRETRPLLKEVVKSPLAIGDGLLRQLRINFFQPLETRLDLKSGQFNRKRRSGDGFAGLFVGFLSTSKRPVEDKPSRARKTGKRRFLPGARINSEPVDLSFRHSFSSAQQVDEFAKPRSWTGIGESTALGVAPRRAKFILPAGSGRAFFGLFVRSSATQEKAHIASKLAAE